MDLVLRAERVLLDGAIRPASVGIGGGMVVDVGPLDAGFTATHEVTLPPETVLLPGFVDTHVHVDDSGTDWEGFATATAAAAAGGITTLVDMPLDSVPVTTTVAALEDLPAEVAVERDRVGVRGCDIKVAPCRSRLGE